MNKNSLEFGELIYFNDSNSFVITGLIIESDKDVIELDEFLHAHRFIPEGKHITGYHHLCDNVLGDEGRSDYLFEVDSCELNPMARLNLRINGFTLMWTSDFIDNYGKDYISRIE